MKRRKELLFTMIGCLALAFLTGCGGRSISSSNQLIRGAVFTWVRVPLTTDLNVTPTAQGEYSDRTIMVKEPFSGYGIYAEVKSNAIGDIARKNGLGKVYFADKETFNVLGVWKTETVYVYGERGDAPPETAAIPFSE